MSLHPDTAASRHAVPLEGMHDALDGAAYEAPAMDSLPTDPVLLAVALRRRLRALSGGQTEAFEMLFYSLSTNQRLAAIAQGAAKRLTFFAMLLADLAWSHGDKNAHDGTILPPAPEVEAIHRVYTSRANIRGQYLMTADQRSAVVDYLNALLVVTARCGDLDEHAPSHTLAREAERFTADVTALRDADFGVR